jgi:PAS domain S-box-containing protein
VLDRDYRIDAVNHAWAALVGQPEKTGVTGGDAQGQQRSIEWLKDDIDDFASGDLSERTVEKPVNTPAGERFFNIHIQRTLAISEKFSGAVVILNDITMQKRTEAALQETTIWLKEMFNALEEAVFIETPDGCIVDANIAAKKIFGYTRGELQNRTTEMLHVDEDHFKAFTDRVRSALDEKGQASFEYLAKRKNGDVFPAMVNIASLKKGDLTPLGIVSIIRDISALKQAEEATQNSERFQGALELAGAVCHDMNQPLMAISGYAELILMECPDGSAFADKLKKIAEQVAKMGDITQKLMRVTRYETKTYMNRQIIDIDKASSKS